MYSHHHIAYTMRKNAERNFLTNSYLTMILLVFSFYHKLLMRKQCSGFIFHNAFVSTGHYRVPRSSVIYLCRYWSIYKQVIISS